MQLITIFFFQDVSEFVTFVDAKEEFSVGDCTKSSQQIQPQENFFLKQLHKSNLL